MSRQAEMDSQNVAYAKLVSTDTYPEVYKRDDDLKVLIDPQTPLFDEKIPYPYPEKAVKKIKKKKRVLSTLDILISIFIVTPCVVGCWRGIWQILDIYAVYFPAWESFSLGMMTHVVLALGQDVFHHLVVEKEPKNPILRVFSVFLMKFYTITFNVINNMVWRAGWILFDRYCGLTTTANGVALGEGATSAIWFTIVCTLILLCLKGLKNTLSPPFSIALDSKDEVFLFSTRYIYKMNATRRTSSDFNLYRDEEINRNWCVKCSCLACGLTVLAMATYCGVSLFVSNNYDPTKDQSQLAEKLVSSPSIQMESFRQPPRPFGIKTMGQPPQKFIPTTTTSTSTTVRPPSMNYPQLSNYRNNYHPKNIQEILGYINQQRSYEDIQDYSKERQATNQQGLKMNSSLGFASGDPFYPYKPSDPSEINLLATASFRFAPPVWKNFRKLYQPPNRLQPSNSQQVETSNVQETIKNFGKPFVISLNVFPMEDQFTGTPLHRYGQRAFSSRLHGVPKVKPEPRARFLGEKGNMITIKLNVFPESLEPLFSQDERGEESNVNKIRFV